MVIRRIMYKIKMTILYLELEKRRRTKTMTVHHLGRAGQVKAKWKATNRK
jgi:hypothetical protein